MRRKVFADLRAGISKIGYASLDIFDL